MSWENYGRTAKKDYTNLWHFDHIIPCDAFDFTDDDEVRACFYYKNLQPLWWDENIRKLNKYEESDKNTYIDSIKDELLPF